ncbi:MAG: redoxin domain-containing protein [Planctomycetaceae bacterium]|nr:redoxin domain-containing protein [Planctomycetaceae bacterium]
MRSAKIVAVAVLVAIVILLLPGRWFLKIPLLRLDSGSSRQSAEQDPLPGSQVATVYVTLSPECPISRGYVPTLNRLYEQFREWNVPLVGLIPAVPAADTDVDQFRADFAIRFPLTIDRTGRLCDQLRMTHMPQAVLVTGNGNILYSGRIDDRYVRIAAAPREVREHSLQNAVMRFHAGQLRTPVITEAVGCVMESRPQPLSGSSEVTYTQHVAPIVHARCVSCHREGELAPFSLTTWQEVAHHAAQIREVVTSGLMPPWRPSAGVGEFANDCRLSAAQVRTITRWIDQGVPQGPSTAEPPLPEFADGWQMGPPDLELIMPEGFTVPADGPDLYQHFVIPTGLDRGRLIRGFEFRPGAPEVVHHAFLYYDTTGQGRELDAADPGLGYSRVGSPGFAVSGSLGGWGPGGLPSLLPEGTGRPLPAASDLVLQVHYHPCGREVVDQSRIGLYYAADWAQRYVTSIMVADVDLAIPAGANSHQHAAQWRLPVDTVVIDITPHMHVLGKSMQARAVLPNGDVLPLIEIKDWDFYWQDTYVFAEPVELPAGTVLQLDCVFDNSDGNPRNPNSPPRDVFWGDYSDDEMAIIYLQATTHTLDDYKTLNAASADYFEAEYDRYLQQQAARLDAAAADVEPPVPR